MSLKKTDLKVAALLPMKAHSARIKGKNFKVFNGHPLYHWILHTLLSVPEIDQIVINTDAEDLLESSGLPQSDRILLRKRKEEICGDFVSMNRVIEDDIQNVPADLYLMTHVTNPLLSKKSISSMLKTFIRAMEQNTADSLFTVNKMQSRFYKADGRPINHNPKDLIRTQDLEPWFEENSNAYVFTAESFQKTGARIGERPLLFESRMLESIDIDNQEGWDLAEALAKSLFENHSFFKKEEHV